MSTAVPSVDLRPDHWAIVRRALRCHVPDREVLAFGSRATWTAKDYSDLDLAVMGEEPLSLRTVSALDEALGDSDLPFKVDVVDWARIDDAFRSVIRRHGVTVQTPAARSDTAGGASPSSPALGFSVALSDWRESKWGDEISLEYGKARRGHSNSTGPFRVFGSNGPIGWTDTPLAPGPGVVLGRKGAYRGVAYSPDPFFVIDTAYYVASKSTQLTCGGCSTQSSTTNWVRSTTDPRFRLPRAPPSTLANSPFPSLHEQRAIAHVLGTLDDKIELNRRMNETLEAMARALFKSWFVDFDPVRAKMEGRDTGLPQDIADLFPDRLVDSEMGEIPEGWCASTLADVALLNPESWSKRNAPDSILYVDLANTKWGYIDDIQIYTWAEAPSRGRRVLRRGDTIVGTVRPGNGSFALIDRDGLTGSTGFAVLRPKTATEREIVWCAATSHDAIERLAHLADGGAYPAVRPRAVLDTVVVLPDTRVRLGFSSLAAPLVNRLQENQREARTLAALRDALLPRLISGEIRVGDAERVVESVT